MFPSVLADYEPVLPANVGWETFSFIHWSKLRNHCFYHKHFQTCCDCNKEVLAVSAGVLCLLMGWMHTSIHARLLGVSARTKPTGVIYPYGSYR